MTLPGLDLTPLVDELSKLMVVNTQIRDELIKMNEREQQDVDAQVSDIRKTLERQYRQQIENLESRLPKNADPTHGRPGGIGSAPGIASP